MQVKKGLGIGERLKELRKSHDLSQAEVAEKLFVSQAAYSLMEGSHSGISSEHIIRFVQLNDVTADFLLMGDNNSINMTTKNGFMPLLNSKAHAGLLKNAHENLDQDFEYYRIPGFNPTADSVLIEIVGESMQPTVMSGDVLVCQLQKNYEHVLDGSVAVAVTDEGLLVKRLQKHSNNNYFWLLGDNPDGTDKKEMKKSRIKQLYMVLGKVSSVLIPRREMAFKGKIQSIEESLNALNKEVYEINRKLDENLQSSSQ